MWNVQMAMWLPEAVYSNGISHHGIVRQDKLLESSLPLSRSLVICSRGICWRGCLLGEQRAVEVLTGEAQSFLVSRVFPHPGGS